MSERIVELGFETDVPRRVERAVDGSPKGLTAEDWFLWSRIDGKSAIRELFTLSGRSRDETIDGLRRLAAAGLIELPNYIKPTPPPEPISGLGERPAAAPDALSWRETELTPPDLGIAFESFEVDPGLLNGESAMPAQLRRVVAYYHTHMGQVTYYQLLGLDKQADAAVVKGVYYRLSKTLHPDRWFRQMLGALEMPLRDVFAWMSKAHRTLTDPKRRAEYDKVIALGMVGPWQVEEKQKRPKKKTTSSSKANVGGGHSLGRNALVARARRHRAEGGHRQAVDNFRKALRMGPDEGLVLELVETQLEGTVELDAALKSVRGIGAQSAQNYAARLLEARILKALGRRAEARTLLKAILVAQPNHSAAKAELVGLDGD